MPSTPLCSPKVRDLSFKDKAKLARVKADPRVYTGKVRLLTGLQFRDASTAIQSLLPTLAFPFAVFHGTADVITPPHMSTRLFDTAASTDKTLFLYEDAYHALYWESPRVRDILVRDIVTWLTTRIAAKGADGGGGGVVCNQRVFRTKEELAGEAPLSGAVLATPASS